MLNPISLAFKKAKQENRAALLTYTVAGDSSKKQSLEILKSISKDEEDKLTDYILNKLDLTNNQYKEILENKNLNFRNFKTYYSTYRYFKFPIKLLSDFPNYGTFSI